MSMQSPRIVVREVLFEYAPDMLRARAALLEKAGQDTHLMAFLLDQGAEQALRHALTAERAQFL